MSICGTTCAINVQNNRFTDVCVRSHAKQSSEFLGSNIQESNKSSCENCDKLKREHKKIMCELKSAQLIIQILRAEAYANIACDYDT